MPKYYIRIVNDDAPEPTYFQRLDAKNMPLLTSAEKFAKRYEGLPLAQEMAAKLRELRSERDGESTVIEVVDAATGNPVTDDYEEPQTVTPEPVPPFPGWETRFEFIQTSTGKKSEFQMCKTPEGIKCRYTTLTGNLSPERPKSEMKTAVANWTDCLRAWLCYQIDSGGKKNAGD